MRPPKPASTTTVAATTDADQQTVRSRSIAAARRQAGSTINIQPLDGSLLGELLQPIELQGGPEPVHEAGSGAILNPARSVISSNSYIEGSPMPAKFSCRNWRARHAASWARPIGFER